MRMTREEAKRMLIECRDDELYPHITEALDVAIEALKQIDEIKKIISADVYIQEDVLRYKMICEVVK